MEEDNVLAQRSSGSGAVFRSQRTCFTFMAGKPGTVKLSPLLLNALGTRSASARRSGRNGLVGETVRRPPESQNRAYE